MSYVTFKADAIDHQQAYRMLIGSIVPRPIAWVSSISNEGVPNLAPFSFFTMVSHYPPMVSISVGERERRMKDTAKNITDTKGYVIHTVVNGWEEKMNATSANFAPDEDEFSKGNLETVSSDFVDAFRIANALVAMDCEFDRIIDFGSEWVTHLVIGKILCWHVREDLIIEDKYIDPYKLAPVGRLGGPRYLSLIHISEPTRPERI